VDYNIRSAQERICHDRIALKGPDTDTLNADMRDRTGVHFNPKGLKKHGEMWAECLIPYIHQMTD
ncbi:MAG: hypothetical protein KBT47_05405, partial [Armatimonadetes bacterium]|nr:hypothetical protein [Candidatus Hippobium faecium]